MKRFRERRGRPTRQKLSTTVARENYAFLQAVAKREATTLAEAVDRVIERARRAQNRRELAQQTAAYFANLPAQVRGEERELESALDRAARELDIDHG